MFMAPVVLNEVNTPFEGGGFLSERIPSKINLVNTGNRGVIPLGDSMDWVVCGERGICTTFVPSLQFCFSCVV